MRPLTDSFGRQVGYLRISVTDRCNLRCRYCMPETGVEQVSHEAILSFEGIEAIVRAGAAAGINKVRLTGGEPLVRKGIVELVARLKQIPGIEELTMTTNGVLLKDYAQALKTAGLDRVNISLDTLDPAKFSTLTRGGSLESVLSGIEAAKHAGLLPLKINVVLMKGFNDNEVKQFVDWTRHEAVEVRFIELMPFGNNALWAPEQFMASTSVLTLVPELKPLPVDDAAAAASLYALDGGKGRVGLISPVSCQFCAQCNRLRLTSKGRLKTCLHGQEEVDLSTVWQDAARLQETLEQAVYRKPKQHQLLDGNTTNRHMVEIGG